MIGSGRGLAGLIAGVAAIFLVLFVVLDAVFGRTPMQRRLGSLKLFTVGARKARPSTPRMLLASLGETVAASPLMSGFAARSAPLLDQLAVAPNPHEWLGIRIVAVLAGNLLSIMFLPAGASIVIGSLAGFLLPNVVLRARIKRRRQRFTDDLPGILHL